MAEKAIELIDLSYWVEQIKAGCPAFAGRVFKTIPDDELSIDLLDDPVAFVYLSADQADDNNSSVITVKQNLTSDVTVEIVIRRTATKEDRFNEQSVEKIWQYRTQVFNALLGWKPEDSIKRVLHIKGELNKKDLKTLRWADVFFTEHTISKKIAR